MPDLEQLLAQWRATLLAAPEFNRETLDELEDHLRELTRQFVRSGLPEPEAFRRAAERLGDPRSLAAELRKQNQATWLPVKLAAGLGVVAVLAAVILVLPRLGS